MNHQHDYLHRKMALECYPTFHYIKALNSCPFIKIAKAIRYIILRWVFFLNIHFLRQVIQHCSSILEPECQLPKPLRFPKHKFVTALQSTFHIMTTDNPCNLSFYQNSLSSNLPHLQGTLFKPDSGPLAWFLSFTDFSTRSISLELIKLSYILMHLLKILSLHHQVYEETCMGRNISPPPISRPLVELQCLSFKFM